MDAVVGARVHREVTQVMGMPVSLALRGRHAGGHRAAEAWAQVVDELREVDAVFSTYRHDSWVSRLARDEVALVGCPPEVGQVLALGEQARLESGGAFDVRRPGPDGRRVLDPSGVVKGWAVERAARRLAGLEGTDFCLSAGGDMVCHVADDTSPDWRIGIEDPADPTRVLAVVPVRDGAVATSGAAHRGDHVVDARTGLSPSALASVTVLADSLTRADIDATCAYAMGADGLTWLTGRPGRSGLIVRVDGTAQVFG